MNAPRDSETPVLALRDLVRQFVDARNWRKFHSPKNLSMSLAIEAAELMEHFQWIGMDESRRVGEDADRFEDVQDELADCLCYALAIANELDIDVTTAMLNKMKKNESKYPAADDDA